MCCVLYSLDDNSQVENLGIVVQYKVKVRLILGFGSGLVIMPVSLSMYYMLELVVLICVRQYI